MKEKHVSEVRSFNRFYTPVIGLMDKYILDSRFSLPEVRVLYEIHHRDACTSSDLVQALGMDKGYLSRLISQFEKKKLLVRKRAGHDSRTSYLFLTATGRKELEGLVDASNAHIRMILEPLSDEQCNKLIHHMAEIRKIFLNTANLPS